MARHSLGGSVRPVGRSERVVHEQLAEAREALRELRVVVGLPGMEAQILEQGHLAGQ